MKAVAEAEVVEEDVVVVVEEEEEMVVGDNGGGKAANMRQRREGATLGHDSKPYPKPISCPPGGCRPAPPWLNNGRFGAVSPTGFVVVIVLEGQGLGAAFEQQGQADEDRDDREV